MFRSLGNNDIKYEDGEIQEIDGIDFVEGNYNINFNLFSDKYISTNATNMNEKKYIMKEYEDNLKEI